MTYTKDSPNKFFLNDKNIAQSLNYGDIQLNAIPSLDLVSSLYNSLSSYDVLLKGNIKNVESELNKASVDISTQVEINRQDDKRELSLTLSSYTNERDLNLSTQLYNRINTEFVHLSGDTVNGSIAVENSLKVKNETYLSGKTYIYGNIAHGKDTKVLGITRGIVLGVSATVENEDAFVWNGDTDKENYRSHAKGTFNINPNGGENGLFIGEKTLSSIIKDDISLTASNIYQTIADTSTIISDEVTSNRKQDKNELSLTLSTYSNQLCSNLSVQININRQNDANDIISSMTNYADGLWQNLSNTISTAGYANYNTFEFNSLTNDHIIQLVLKGNYPNEIKSLSIDTTDFIKNRIVDHVEVVDITTPTGIKKALRIYWSNSTGALEYTDILIEDLAKIYKAGDGIDITRDLVISANNTIARQNELLDTRSTVNKISVEIVPIISANVDSIQSYIDILSDDSTPHHGIIWSLSDAITADVKNLEILSTDVKSISSTHSECINIISNDVNVIKAFDNMLSIDVNNTPTGVIPNLSAKIDNIAKAIRITANYAGKIQFNKYHPDFEKVEGEKVMLSDVFEYYGYGTLTNPIKNGNIYEVVFDLPKDSVKNDPLSDYYTFDNPVFAADQYYDCIDFRLAHRDFIYVAINDYTIEYVPLKDVATYAKTLAGAKFYEAAHDVKGEVWLSGNNNDTATYLDHVIRYENRPKFIQLTGHCISGSNHFVGGNNVFDGNTYFDMLSANKISADWREIKHTTGYSLFDLSTALSNKIKIDDQIDHTINGTSDLSIVKIEKEKFDELVAYEQILCADTLYVVDSPVIDAYGQSIINLTMSNNNIPSEGTNKNYVDTLSTNLSNDIRKLSSDLSADIRKLSTELSTDIRKLSSDLSADIRKLSTDIRKLSSDLSSDIRKLSSDLSTDINVLSVNLSNDIKNICGVFSKLYNKISTINEQSILSDIIYTVVEIKNALSVF